MKLFILAVVILLFILFPQAAPMFIFIGGVILVGFFLGWADANRPVPPTE